MTHKGEYIMNTVTIILTVEQHRNLMVFLNRVDVKGMNEASALVDLAQTIGSAKPAEEPKPE